MRLTQQAQLPDLVDPAALPEQAVPGLYVHVPFCVHKCHYCDFYSITRQTPERMYRFVDLLLAEADLWLSTRLHVRPRTVFFGGGTPTLLPLAEMQRLIQGLRERLDFSGLEEWTIEANPATVTDEYCAALRGLGVDRLSFGAQSFNPDELRMLERHHDPQDVPRSVEIARRAGFARLNLDLIYAIPGQSLESWAASLDRTVALGTEHISAYALTYEPNTPMAVRKRLGQFTPAEESLEIAMMRHVRQRLRAVGYRPYEISNYARPGEECRHNLLYWDGGNYIGLGPSAASHVEGRRWKNRPHLGEWEQAVAARTLPAADHEVLLPRQRFGEWVMLRLRLQEGIAFADFAARWGCDAREVYADVLGRLRGVGLIEIDDAGFGLSEAGIVVADGVAGEFL